MAQAALKDERDNTVAELAPFQRKTAEASPPPENRPAPTGDRPAPIAGDGVPTAAGSPPPPAKRSGKRRLILLAVLVVALSGAAYYGHSYWTTGRFMISTDDAYVNADTATLAPRVSGYVVKVAATDNTPVKAGDLLVYLDDADQKLALTAAQDQVATQQAALDTMDRQIEAAQASVTQAKAAIVSAQADAELAAADLTRASRLAANQFGTQQSAEQAKATNDKAAASVDSTKAGLVSAEANVTVLQAQRVQAERVLDQDKAAVLVQQLNLDHLVVRAPYDGVVGNRAVDPGEFVAAGQRLMALVPLQEVYVDANFKETQIEGIRAGSEATITVDAFPDQPVVGTVVSISPASGSAFSLLPTDNATGNFTKITQRIPVRIKVPADVAAKGLFRPGLSAVVSIDTRTGGDAIATTSK